METTEFKRRMEERLQRWYHSPPHPDPEVQQRRHSVAMLANKSEMHAYATRMNIPLPRRFAEVDSVDALDFRALPHRVVVKPNNQCSQSGVCLFDRGREVFSGDIVPLAERQDYVRERLAQVQPLPPGTKIIAEEFVEDFEPEMTVPRAFKTFVAGGRTWVTKVVDRNGPGGRTTERYYSRDWTPYDLFQTTNPLADPIPEPMHYRQLLDLSDRIARDIECFMRLDFYITPRGVLFGEFTSYPNAGNRYTALGSKVLCDLMDRYPDPF